MHPPPWAQGSPSWPLPWRSRLPPVSASGGVRHHVPAQRLLLQTVDQDASFHAVRDDEVDLLLEAPMSRSHDSMSF